MAPVPTNLSFVGIAKETTKGTGVSPTNYIPVDKIILHERQLYLDDKAMRGSMVDVYNEVPGVAWCEIEMGGPVFADSIGWALAGMLGDVTTTGASAPYSHAMAVQNGSDGQCKSYTITEFYGVTQARQVAGFQFSDLSFKANADGLLEWTAKGAGFASTQVAKPTAAWTAVTPEPAWESATNIAGSAATGVLSMELNLKRNVSPIHTIDGTAAPYKIWQGPLSVAGKLSLLHETDAELTRYLTNTQPAVYFDWTHGAAAALVEVKLNMTKCAYTDTSGIDLTADYTKSDYSISAVANTTDVGASGGYGQLKATIQNALPSGTYV